MNFSRATASFVNIAGHEFSGPFTATRYLEPRPGVFVILDIAPDNSWTVLDVDVLEDVRGGVGTHKRWGAWMKAARGRVAVADFCPVLWNREEIDALAAEIRGQYRPPCGPRSSALATTESTLRVMDTATRTVLKWVETMGYNIDLAEPKDESVTVSARHAKTGETFIVRGADLYAAACELAERIPIELDDG